MGRIIGVRVIDVSDYGRSALVTELHSTKGWKAPYRIPIRIGWRDVVPDSYTRAKAPPRRLFCDGSRIQPNRDLVLFEPRGSTRHLVRHGWYRRQQRKLEAANA